MGSIRVENLTKIFKGMLGSTAAVDDLCLEVREGEFFTLVGPSGCGKTTSLRMIAGLETPTRGNVFFDGQRVTDLPPQKRNVSMMFQNVALFPHMTVAQNIGYPLKIRKVSRSETEQRVMMVSKMLGITDKLEMKPGQLSGGQRQRAALGRAIVGETGILLMDEPLSSLDAKLRAEMRTEILRIHRRINATIVYVTHDQVEALSMSSRIALMKDGKCLQVDSPAGLFKRPANVDVAAFIGTPSMNLLSGRVIRTEETMHVQFLGETIPLSDEAASRLGGPQDVLIGLRPQRLRLRAQRGSPHDIPVTIDVIEPLGVEQQITAKTAQVPKITIVREEASDFKEGDRAYLSFDYKDAYIFDRDSGRTISFTL
jgi:multiple sugar transport system ATP-binding protein